MPSSTKLIVCYVRVNSHFLLYQVSPWSHKDSMDEVFYRQELNLAYNCDYFEACVFRKEMLSSHE